MNIPFVICICCVNISNWDLMGSFKSNQTAFLAFFFTFFDIFEGNRRLPCPFAVKIYSFVDECDPRLRVRFKLLSNNIKCVNMRVKVA